MPPRAELVFIEALERAIRERCGIAPRRIANGLTLPPIGPDGFEMTVVAGDHAYALYFDGWAEEFGCEEIVHRLVTAAAAGEARIRVDSLAGRRLRWTLETRDCRGGWQPESTLSHVTWRFWGTRSTAYLMNAGWRAGATRRSGASQPLQGEREDGEIDEEREHVLDDRRDGARAERRVDRHP